MNLEGKGKAEEISGD